MNNLTEPQYWQYQVRASMAGMPRRNELLVAKSQGYTRTEAIAYCKKLWGDNFIENTLVPYSFPTERKISEQSPTETVSKWPAQYIFCASGGDLMVCYVCNAREKMISTGIGSKSKEFLSFMKGHSKCQISTPDYDPKARLTQRRKQVKKGCSNFVLPK